MHAILHYFFDWYTGQVWPNIIASGLITLAVWLVGFRRLALLHKRGQAQLHNHISQEFRKLKENDM